MYARLPPSTPGVRLTECRDEESRRDEILDALDTYLQQNATRLSRNSTFEPYYGVRRTPFKARSSSTVPGVTSDDGEVKSVVRGRGRRATKVKQELEYVSPPPQNARTPLLAHPH